MSFCQMLLHQESAFDCLIELGYIGVVQFINSFDIDANQKYTSEMQRCIEIQRIIKHLEEVIEDCGNIRIVFYPDVDIEVPQAGDIKNIERILQQFENELVDVDRNYDALRKEDIILLEKLHVLKKVDMFLSGERNTEALMAWSDSVIMNLLRDETRRIDEDVNMRLGFYAGSITAERLSSFEIMLWRLCYSNFLLKTSEIPEPIQDIHSHLKIKIRKYAFMVFFVGEVFREKIGKVCQGFRATLYECPESREERQNLILRITNSLDDLKIILRQTELEKKRICMFAAADLYIWKVKAKKILMVYSMLNRLGTVQHVSNHKYLQTKCWIPTKDILKVREALFRGAKHASKGETSMMFPPILTENFQSHDLDPPTYYSLNKFTRGFQNLIDAYGVALYQELNPAPYTIITFPFLFAVMFGDIGHGIIMALFGMWMVVKEKQLEQTNKMEAKSNEIWSILFAGRYIIMLMGIFSIYTGFIYNDIFSKSFNIFGSQWRVNYTENDVNTHKEIQLDPALQQFYLGSPYFFGIDPVWDASGENAIITLNSMKMKMAVILGVFQMIFGLMLSAVNFVYFRSGVDFFFVFIPQIVFLSCLFFYLIFLIFHKWCVYGGHLSSPQNSSCAPSILVTFINMILMKKPDEVVPPCSPNLYNGQELTEKILISVAFASVPILLIGKPLHYICRQRRLRSLRDSEIKKALNRDTVTSIRRSMVYSADYVEASSHIIVQSDEGANLNIGELWIHQGIHCIESVLGSVSHTASYLRLWALSLAHDQLSTVLWNMVLAIGLKGAHGWLNSIVIYFVFWIWAILTVSILVIMEGLSAFLHTLRLHWVEFQSKFYSGAGELFFPFRFEPSTVNG